MIKISMDKVRNVTERKFEKVSIKGLAGYELGEKMLQWDVYVFTASSASTTPNFFLNVSI